MVLSVCMVLVGFSRNGSGGELPWQCVNSMN